MKRIYLISAITLISLMVQAQSSSRGVGIQYNMLMLQHESLKDVSYEYEPGVASTFSKFYLPEMKVYSSAFLDYVAKMRSVKNFVGPFGTVPPSSMGDRGFEEAIKKIDNGKLERVGRMYMEVAQYEDQVTIKNDSIFLAEDAIVVNERLLSGPDTVFTENLSTGEMEETILSYDHDFYERASGAGFIEEWFFDHRRGSFRKEVKYISLMTSNFDPRDQEFRGMQYLFTFKAGKFNKKHINSERLIRKDVEYNVLFNRDFTRGDQEINFAGMARTSDAFGYIEPTERMQFLISILHNVKNGQLPIYRYNSLAFNLDELEKVHNISWFEGLSQEEKVYVEDLEDGSVSEITITTELALGDAVGIRFFEDWYSDPDNMTVYKRVNGIVFLKEVVDEDTGEPKGVAPLSPYYIKLNPQH